MEKEIKYALEVSTNFNIKNFLSYNNQTSDSYFRMDEFEMGNPCFFSSTLLNELNDVQEIYNKASQIISIYEGIYTLLDRNKSYNKYFRLTNLYDIDKKRIISRTIKSDIYKIDIDFSIVEKSNQTQKLNSVYVLFETIVADEFLTNLFFLLSKKIDFKLLYMIYDDIRFYLKSIGDKKCVFLDKYSNSINIFTHTANNYEVLGFFARHGRTNTEPPKKPMTLNDSMNLIFDIIIDLLKEKFEIDLPNFWGLVYMDFNENEIENLFEN